MKASQRLIEAIESLQQVMNADGVDPTQGLPEELFIFGTTLMPVSNVDLFITNDSGQVLLSWRDDQHYGKYRHIPGGCIRLRESWIEKIQKTAVKELGSEVEVVPAPMVVRESMTLQPRPWLSNQLERTHNTSILFACKLPEKYEICNDSRTPETEGYLKWFDSLPADLLQCHCELYRDILENWFKGKKRYEKGISDRS